MSEAKDFGMHKLLMDTVEKLIAENGFAAVKVRDITKASGLNVNAVNYYFRSKDELLLAAFNRRAREISVARLAALKKAMAQQHADRTVREVLRALVETPLRHVAPDNEYRYAAPFVARARLEGTPEIRGIILDRTEVLIEFADALQELLPHLSREDIVWRLFFILSIEHDLMTSGERIFNVSGGICSLDDVDEIIEKVLDFAVAGLTLEKPS